MLLFLEQLLNGVQLSVTLLLMASGLTLVFGIMNLLNLAHGSLFMAGAYVAAWTTGVTGSWLLGLVAGAGAAFVTGVAIELVVMRRLYTRDHLDQVLATFGLILFFNELVRLIWGIRPMRLDVPEALNGFVEIVPGAPYPVYRLAVIAAGALVMLGLAWLVQGTRVGMRIRAGSVDREMIGALGVDIGRLYTLVFALGALLAGLAGVLAGPFLAIQSGMGEPILILAFVVVVIGGIGSLKGAVAGSLLVGITDTLGRVYLPKVSDAGTALSSMLIFLVMAVVLALFPTGLYGRKP
ncbi:branched-chain amino acid ABC transporter permease [Caenispirillum bisanense]|uniref:Amino acid/amide ABC transporter membrane protein 1, HAAT family n=1 Tax=Caenispirillum bisanense TaxID=414052 RepID=A0A286GRH7_9PROT|nr:branched-chain amino acid ABC transporter permease [Caenispirillum bisanense]SOD98165.1 amino acid/amide ABC transporter membrane protein 1, HAAT family [Caenispirillum bisanense]